MQITSLFSGLTVFENIWTAVQSRKKFFNPFIRALKWQDVKEKTESMLELTGLKDKAQLICSELSYGDQRILEMGIALSTEPDLLCTRRAYCRTEQPGIHGPGQEDEKYAFRANDYFSGT